MSELEWKDPTGNYEYVAEMGEISGFGGGYEDACRAMVKAGCLFLAEDESRELRYGQFKHVYGITTDENDDSKAMQDAMLEAVGNDCTSAMMQTTMNHVMFIRKNGWSRYVVEMSKEENQ